MNQQPVAQAEGAQQTGGFSIWKIIIMYFAMSQIMSFFSKPPTDRQAFINVVKNGEQFVPHASYYQQTLRLHINTTNGIDWVQEDLYYDTASENFRIFEFSLTAEELLSNPNITAFMEFHFRESDYYIHKQFKLCTLLKKKLNLTKNLMFDAQEEYMIKRKEEDTANLSKVLHVKGISYINMVHDVQPYTNQIPPQILNKYNFSNISGFGMRYTPYVDTDNYRLRRKDMHLVDDVEVPGDKMFNLTFEFQTQAYWKFMIQESLKDSGKTYEQFGMADLMSDEVTQDQMKEMLFETNIYLVVATFLVSILHTIFSTLAIKNDYQYWKNLESCQGISVRMLYQNFVLEIIITLYLFDNETSWLILVQSVVELGLMVWKILKTTKFKFREDKKFPYIQLDHNITYKSTTQEFDKTAMKYLYRLLVPLFIGYMIYSLIYEEHKGWYSFFLSSCVGFIYLFGFINMCPQLYINYKLKSVAHLPWRMMVYKFLNTIVDDFFAFIITMPWLKRLSCFRDDVIFLIYLYQRRIYRVDMNRQDNGQSFDQPIDEVVPEPVNHAKQD